MISISSVDEAIEIFKRGEKNRHFASTSLNHNSSRAHSIFRIFTTYTNSEKKYLSVCNLVDLAGSEKMSLFSSENKLRISESKSINKSLFFLTQIINQLGGTGNIGFIPYRNSTLTKILKNSIGGNAMTAIILCINPMLHFLDTTMNTLKFGSTAKNICN